MERKLSKAHFVHTPYEYYQLFIDKDIMKNITDQTNIYSVQKSGRSINTILINVCLYSVYYLQIVFTIDFTIFFFF